MDAPAALLLVLALVAVATALGLVYRARQGRIRPVADPTVLVPADVGSQVPFGPAATLVQFSTEFCSRCPGTHRLLSQIADGRPGVAHVDVDLTHRADLANRFGVLQTPTTLILDGAGRVHARVGGAPHRADVLRHLDHLAGPESANPLTASHLPGSPHAQ
ncbi:MULTISPECIES: thioredoxin family protein [unclassified Cryobacterium]|uniref:TlpA family protein disulfide reductase n=1 Tax=unclassified Cryobacterium TaxID=2649013 RepID=UPI00106BE76E|nr:MULTISPECIES: thioredoxin family protein [unclassified Cryobacterium]TFC00578.1 thioredoxin [Cryobacterium sp. MDB2-A-1]TFC13587.1 thioredoxin [Cryobacterium sp. MDB2-A-2]TFC15036.1 thioredoxin [Cryobacterium sp. MDB2-10]